MSIDLDWEGLTAGPDGERFSESIRSFLDDKFQNITLPSFVRSVQVQSFNFGTIPPDLEIIDICDPFPDFYEDDDDSYGDEDDEHKDDDWNHNGDEAGSTMSDRIPAPQQPPSVHPSRPSARQTSPQKQTKGNNLHGDLQAHLSQSARNELNDIDQSRPSSSRLERDRTPPRQQLNEGWPNSGYTDVPFPNMVSNMHTSNRPFWPFNHPLSGTATPFAAATGFTAGHRYQNSFQHLQQLSGMSDPNRYFPTDTDPASSNANADEWSIPDVQSGSVDPSQISPQDENDFQVLCRVQYSGDVQMTVTVDLLLDFPLAGSVGIPVKLNITGVSFNGVAVFARIRDGKQIHICFLPPEDSPSTPMQEHPTGSDHNSSDHSFRRTTSGTAFGNGGGIPHHHHHHGTDSSPGTGSAGILSSIHVESEIGAFPKEGKQALTNVGKVERFVLDQVRRVFETELVFPSFWTFLV